MTQVTSYQTNETPASNRALTEPGLTKRFRPDEGPHIGAPPPLSSDLPFADFIDPLTCKNIVDNESFPEGDWEQICRLKDTRPGVNKRVIPVDLRPYCMLVVSTVEPNTEVEGHSHDEGIIRFIVEGSFTLNGKRYTAGDWVFVPSGMLYEICTSEGYTAVAGYYTWCR